MVKYTVLVLTFSAFTIALVAQSSCSTFTLTGTIGADTGKMLLMPVGRDDSYYSNDVFSREAKIEKGSFTFTGPILYPYAARLGLKINAHWKYLSDVFFIDPCTQTITCNIDSALEMPGISNESMLELRRRYLPSYSEVIAVERKKIEAESQLILLEYVKTNPSSFVGLWELIKKFNSYSYKPVYDSIYNQFSDSIKETYTGKELARRLDSSRLTAGSPFPPMAAVTKNGRGDKTCVMARNFLRK